MVELVLRRARIDVVELVAHLLALLVAADERDLRRALDRHEHALDRKAALVGDRGLVGTLGHLGIDDGGDLVLARLEDEEPADDADLRRGEADPRRLLHQPLHPRDEAAQIVVELLDRPCLHAQGDVRVLADLREREPAARLALRIELFLDYLPVDIHAAGTLAPVDPREAKEILGQGATRPETPRDRAERRTIEADLVESPVKGKPLRQRVRNFRPDADAAIRALGGPAMWMRRLRAIEDAVDQHERQLTEAWHELALGTDDAGEFERLWRETATRWDFAELNHMIERHNRYFPAEARLAMDPRTRDFVRINGRPYQREPLDAEWILARWPADRLQALRVDVDHRR